MFVYLLNRYRTNKCFELSNENAMANISELVKIVLDEIQGQLDTNIALQCMLLTSTFYYN